jgi:2,4-dienoyl-CoA reductase-like NADH-dependent reductase (Old Yellow Enzyme family)
MNPLLFQPFVSGDVTLRNRIVISPMCQNAADPDGHVADWHLVHLGSRAAGGAGLVMVEATSVLAEGRLSPTDTGIWMESHVSPLKRIADFVRAQGAAAGLQLVHGGRKAAEDTRGHGAPRLVAPSAIAAGEGWKAPEELSRTEMDGIVQAFRAGAERAVRAGFDVLELHAAHGYLLHSFLSPISNRRTDDHGGDLAGRASFVLRVAAAVREVWPRPKPLWLRLSCVDAVPGGLQIADGVAIAKLLAPHVDLVDCSSGGVVEGAKLPQSPGFQLPFSRRIRAEAGVPTCGVGRMTDALACERALARGDADVIAIARASLADPYWPFRAAKQLGVSLPYLPSVYRTRQLFVRRRDELWGKAARLLLARKR